MRRRYVRRMRTLPARLLNTPFPTRRRAEELITCTIANVVRAINLLSDRPCMRCVKRNIGHLCHDEAREPKKPKTDAANAQDNDQEGSHTPPSRASLAPPPVDGMSKPLDKKQEVSTGSSNVSLPPPPIPPSRSNAGVSIVAPSPVSVVPRSNLRRNSQACMSSPDI